MRSFPHTGGYLCAIKIMVAISHSRRSHARYDEYEKPHNLGVVAGFFQRGIHHAGTGIEGWTDIADNRRFEQRFAGDGSGGAEAERLSWLHDRAKGPGYGRAPLAPQHAPLRHRSP